MYFSSLKSSIKVDRAVVNRIHMAVGSLRYDSRMIDSTTSRYGICLQDGALSRREDIQGFLYFE
jgi:hypothetical protein